MPKNSDYIPMPVVNQKTKLSEKHRRPKFGSPEVAKYGAVGLEVRVNDDAATKKDQPQLPSTKSMDGQKDIFQVSPNHNLAIIEGLAHHEVDNYHLWIAVQDGKLIVADRVDHELMKVFIESTSPRKAANRIAELLALSYDLAWDTTLKFIGRLAAGGFIKGIRGYHSEKKIRPHSFARFHLTNRCQLECVHCYTNSSPNLSSAEELSSSRWIELVDEFADNGGEKILFTGGEALVYKGCIEVMRQAHSRGLEVTLFSNGILVPRYIKDITEVVDIAQISLDGPGEETHDAIRGNGSFRKAIRAINLLLEAGIETRVSTTIMMNNWPAIKKELPSLISSFEETQLSFRISYGAMPHGRGKNLDHSLNTDEVREFVDKLLARVKTTENRDEGMNVVQKISGCGYAEQLVIAPNGYIYPCHLLSGALGHVDDLPVKEITKYLVRTAEAFGVDNRVGCGTCDLRHLCGGTCRIEDEKHTMSRLITTCTDKDKLRKKRFLINRYKPKNYE